MLVRGRKYKTKDGKVEIKILRFMPPCAIGEGKVLESGQTFQGRWNLENGKWWGSLVHKWDLRVD